MTKKATKHTCKTYKENQTKFRWRQLSFLECRGFWHFPIYSRNLLLAILKIILVALGIDYCMVYKLKIILS